MKKTNTLIVIFAFGLTTAYSQVFEWVVSSRPVANGAFYGKQPIKADNSGNLVTGLPFGGTIDVDPGSVVLNFQSSGVNEMDFCIRKLNDQGNLIWARQFGSADQDYLIGLTTGSDQSIYVLASFGNTVDFDPSASGGEESAGLVLFKLNASGTYQWSKKLGGFYPKSLVADGNDNLLIGGYFYGNADFDPGPGSFVIDGGTLGNSFILKLTPTGDFQWAKSLISDSNILGDMAVDAAGNVYHTGAFNGTVDFDPGTAMDLQTSNASGDFYVHKLNAQGDYQWVRTIGNPLTEISKAIAVTSSGDVYITGAFQGTIDFDPGAGNTSLQAADQTDMFLQKFNSNGVFQWVKQFSNPVNKIFSSDLICDSDGNVYLTGQLDDPADDNDPVLGTTSDIFVYNYKSDGTFVWEGMIEGRDTHFESNLAISPANELYISGIWVDSTDFDPSENDYLLADVGPSSFITKWGVQTLGLSDIQGENMKLYPNPTISDLVIDLNGEQGQVVLKVYDLSGKLVIESEQNGAATIMLDLSALESGIYVLELNGENEKYAARVVKQ